MKLNELESKLLAAAQECPPADHVPFAFEKRIMARLRQVPALDTAWWWNRMLWRAAVPSILVMLSVSLWSLLAHDGNGTASLGTELENAVLAPAYAAIEESW